jgi:serine/threonine protein phosphatase 1
MNVLSWIGAARPIVEPSVDAGTRVYAIGDIHGRCDLLRRLHTQITADIETAAPDLRIQLVFLGDYIDRGPSSRQVVDFLLSHTISRAEKIYLVGNHEATLLAFLKEPETTSGWLRYGGDATLRSYGIALEPSETPGTLQLKQLGSELLAKLPPQHIAFYNELKLSFRNGDYFFAHAGIDPRRPLDKQDPQDLIWIREAFTGCAKFSGTVVVHGHTITSEPAIHRNRIGIDTGAYRSGRLTCLVLEGTERRFLSTRA